MNRLVVVSNRVPVPADAAGAGAGGLAVALAGLLERRGGLWFGWSGKVDPAAADQEAKVVRHGATDYATVDLTRTEHDRYYNNFSNGVLWPLLHTLPELMAFNRRDAAAYMVVNRRFAEALQPLLRAGDTIWVHDYHLIALPALLRASGVAGPIGFFLHIPFCPPEVLAHAPNATELVTDLLAADLIGFQTQADLDNFTACATLKVGADSIGPGRLKWEGRPIALGVFPAEIDCREFATAAATAGRGRECQRLCKSLDKQSLILGVDRLDPTKGLIQRLAGFRRMLERHPEWHRRTTLLQIAAVSRKDVSAYRDLRLALDHDAGSINSDFAEPDWAPLRLVAKAGARNIIAGYMRCARVGLVTPVRDGMNLVAKEYVAAQDPANPGVLILSEFAGAAQQLHGALLVNPYDADQMSDMLDRALRMPLAERQERWQGMWDTLQQTSPVHWGRSFLGALTEATAEAPAGRVQMLPFQRRA
jgi:trehalose 6-phosphate synthase